MKLAKLKYFYGFSHAELSQLSNATIEEYWQAITIIEAQNLLQQITVVQFPNMKKQHREKLVSRLNKQAYPFTKKLEMTGEQLQEFLAERLKRGK